MCQAKGRPSDNLQSKEGEEHGSEVLHMTYEAEVYGRCCECGDKGLGHSVLNAGFDFPDL